MEIVPFKCQDLLTVAAVSHVEYHAFVFPATLAVTILSDFGYFHALDMDLDASLTPPRSPVVDDDEMQFESSPVLVSKGYRRTGKKNEGRHVPTHTEYLATEFMKCHSPINGRASYMEHHNDGSLIANAWKYWSGLNDSEELRNGVRRKVMSQEMHLNDLTEPDSDFLYQVVMYFHDIADIVKQKMRTGTSICTKTDMELIKKSRRYIEESMLFVCEFVEKCDEDTETSDVLINIFDMMVMISNMCHSSILEGSKIIVRSYLENSETGRKMNNPAAEWYHCYILVQSTLLKLLPLLYTHETVMHHINSTQVFFDNCVEVMESGFYHKIVKKIFSLTLNIALQVYVYSQRNTKTDRGTLLYSLFFESPPFPCLCMQQLLSLCLHTAVQMELKKQAGQGDSDTFVSQAKDLNNDKRLDNCASMFWKMISIFISNVLQDVTKKKSHDKPAIGPTLKCLDTSKDALSFCWWWTWEVARLFLFNDLGEYKMRVTSTSHMPLLSKLLRLTFSTCDGDMELVSLHLSCYRTIVSFWRSCSDHSDVPFSVELAHFNMLWTHFCKKLNLMKKSDSYGMQRYTTTDDKTISPEKWITKCNMYLNEKENHCEKSLFVVLDSFKSFLLIFGEILHFGCWKELKSKFFARLQINEMRMLTDHGLANFFHLFLLIASSNIDNTERLDVFSKLASYLEQVSFTKTDYRKMKVMLNGLFSCMHVGLSLQHPIKLRMIAKKCGTTAAAVFKLFSDASRNLEQRNSIWKLIEFYFKNVTQIFQISSSFHLCQDMLLPSENSRTSLSVFKCSEAVSILGNLTAILSTLRIHLQHCKNKESFSSCVSTVNALFNFFLPWLKILARTEDNAAEDIVNTLIEMCGLILQIDKAKQSAITPVKLSNILSHFCCSVHIRLPIRCNFVLRILSDECQELIDSINGSNVESSCCQTALIQGALKGIVCHPDKECRDNIAKSLSNICVIRDLFEYAAENGFENFLMALRDKPATLQVEQQKRLRDQVSEWFNPITEIISTLTNSDVSNSMVIYKMCGVIVKHCGSILYSPGNRGLVTQVFDILVLPRAVYVPRDKNINTALRSALSKTLDVFVIGLLNLDYGRDTYVQRVLRDIVNIYLTRFPARFQAGTISTPHPFTRVCLSLDLEPSQRSVFLKVLDNHCKDGREAKRSISTLIDILHVWVRQATEMTHNEVSMLQGIMVKARFIDDDITRRKCEFINHKVKEISL